MILQSCPIPGDEEARLFALQNYQILDTPSDGAFDQVTALVARLLKVPIAIVSLVDHDRIWFKSHHGVEVRQIDRAPGLCASAIMEPSVYVVSDARTDPRTLTNPLVAGGFGLQFYAAAPLTTSDGHNLGTLCVLDFVPRELNETERTILETMARIVMEQMELRLAARKIDELSRDLLALNQQLKTQASHDSMTGLWNRGAIMELFDQTHARASREGRPLSVMMIDIDHFKRINDSYGHQVGDQVIVEVARRLESRLRSCDTIGRVGGEEFLAILYPCELEQARVVGERCREVICDLPVLTAAGPLAVTISAGTFAPNHLADRLAPDEVLRTADDALYKSKQRGRNCVTIA